MRPPRRRHSPALRVAPGSSPPRTSSTRRNWVRTALTTGRGRYGQVFKGFYADSPVAIKVLDLDDAKNVVTYEKEFEVGDASLPPGTDTRSQ